MAQVLGRGDSECRLKMLNGLDFMRYNEVSLVAMLSVINIIVSSLNMLGLSTIQVFGTMSSAILYSIPAVDMFFSRFHVSQYRLVDK